MYPSQRTSNPRVSPSKFVQLTRTNTAIAVDIAKRIGALIRLLNETVDGVKAEIQRLDVGNTMSRVDPSNKLTQFDVVIQGLERYGIYETY